MGPVGIYPFLQSESRLETTCTLVGFTGGSAANFLEGLDSNRQIDSWPGEKNINMLHPPDTSWR